MTSLHVLLGLVALTTAGTLAAIVDLVRHG